MIKCWSGMWVTQSEVTLLLHSERDLNLPSCNLGEHLKLWPVATKIQKRAALLLWERDNSGTPWNGGILSNSDIFNIWLPPASIKVSAVARVCFSLIFYFFNFNSKWFPIVEKHFYSVLQGSVMLKAKLNFLKVQRHLVVSKSAVWSLGNSVRSEDLLFAFHSNCHKHNWPGNILLRQTENLEKEATFRYVGAAYKMVS